MTAVRIRSRKRLPSGPCVPKDVFLVARSPRESRLRRAPGRPLEEAVSLAPQLPAEEATLAAPANEALEVTGAALDTGSSLMDGAAACNEGRSPSATRALKSTWG